MSQRTSSPAAGADRLMRLEYLRGAAASYVFLHHYVRTNLPDHAQLAALFPFGQAAVLVFFLLSGFVIHYASLGPHPDMPFGRYFMRRARRIFPIFAIALACTYLGSSLHHRAWINVEPRELVLNFLQLQDRAREGNWAVPYLGNSPLWSLSYEWWFYMLYFPLERGLSARPEWRRAVVLGVSLAGVIVDVLWPNPFAHIAAYLVIWWLGVEVAREYSRTGSVRLRQQAFSVASICVITLLWGLVTWRDVSLSTLAWYEYPGLTFRHFLTTLGLIAAGWAWYRAGLRGFDLLLGPFRWIAGFSYALYVLHLPLLWIARSAGGTGWFAFLWVAPFVLACCWCVERLLVPLGQRARAALPRTAPREQQRPA